MIFKHVTYLNTRLSELLLTIYSLGCSSRADFESGLYPKGGVLGFKALGDFQADLATSKASGVIFVVDILGELFFSWYFSIFNCFVLLHVTS